MASANKSHAEASIRTRLQPNRLEPSMLLPSLCRRRVLLFLFLVAVTVGVAWFLATREPRYHGKAISAWVAQLKQTSNSQSNEVFDVLLNIGPDSLPPLVTALNSKESVFSKTY